ncbi:MAG: uracil-DNA glycosylase family protein [Gammaproteobacteria bacterium]|nr:uracil-DNA glycosylase family protein [Gammaproteobacteria bacterium]
MSTEAETLRARVDGCTLCVAHLPLGPRPILQLSASARILIAGQAPGRRTHDLGVPFADASGDRLRDWLGMSREVFYSPEIVAILPMGFCFPGTGKQGDLPPRPECAPAWRVPLLATLSNLQLTLVIGQYAQAWHLPGSTRSVTAVVQDWRKLWPKIIPLPHPSPRNNRWLRTNPWFEIELLPALRLRISEILAGSLPGSSGE